MPRVTLHAVGDVSFTRDSGGWHARSWLTAPTS